MKVMAQSGEDAVSQIEDALSTGSIAPYRPVTFVLNDREARIEG